MNDYTGDGKAYKCPYCGHTTVTPHDILGEALGFLYDCQIISSVRCEKCDNTFDCDANEEVI